MSHVLSYAGQYFGIDVSEVVTPDASPRTVFVGWASEAFRELKELPVHACSRLIPGPPLATHFEALQHAYDWVKSDWDSRQLKRPTTKPRPGTVIYTVSVFQAGSPSESQFEEFADAKSFAKAAEKMMDVNKVVITNNESPQHLMMWERGG
jgi:hypothetical protein